MSDSDFRLSCIPTGFFLKEPLTLTRSAKSHCHEPETEEVMRREVIGKMKKSVVEEPEKSVKRVYRDVLKSFITDHRDRHDAGELGVALPTFDSVSSILHRGREEVRPQLPKTRRSIELNDSWKKTETGGVFLRIDDTSSNPDVDDRILGFASDEAFAALCAAQTVFMDGTFRIVPHLFSQLYTLHAFVGGQMMPLAFFLLPSKTTETYVRMFNLLRIHALSRQLTFNPREFQLDFETAALNAIREVFPQAERKGCNFHFSQCLWRKIQELGLQKFYKVPGVKTTVRSIGAIAFVPEDNIDDAWLLVNAESPGEGSDGYEALEAFKEYFIVNWLENTTVHPRRLWNHYRNFEVRTTNHLEAWHRALNRVVGRAHVNIFELIKHLKVQEAQHSDQMMLLRAGQAPPRQRRQDRERNRRLRGFVDDYENGRITLLEYVKKVGANHRL